MLTIILMITCILNRKKDLIFDAVADSFRKVPEGQGISEMKKWQLAQPGFIDIPAAASLGNIGQMFTSSNPYSWDGTFNQPTLPLADTKHRSSKMLYRG